MSELLTPRQVEDDIIRLVRLLDKATMASAKRARESAHADVAFRGAWAVAICAAEGKTVDAREAEATTATIAEYEAKRIAEAVLWSSTEAGRNIRAQLDSLRSINTNLREVVMHGGADNGDPFDCLGSWP